MVLLEKTRSFCKSTSKAKNNIKKINKLLNLSTNYMGEGYKTIYLIKVKKKLYVFFFEKLVDEKKIELFDKNEQKINLHIFGKNEMNFFLQPRT